MTTETTTTTTTAPVAAPVVAPTAGSTVMPAGTATTAKPAVAAAPTVVTVIETDSMAWLKAHAAYLLTFLAGIIVGALLF